VAIALCPGSFDPVTNGHLDIVERAARYFDRVIVAVIRNPQKTQTLFTLEERKEMLGAVLGHLPNVEIDFFKGLLVDFARGKGADAIVKGLRAVSDFDYEFQMTGMNARLNPDIETVFLMASERSQFISSRFVKEIHKLGGDVSQFVSPRVVAALKGK
jgi:pantetheine-phosphate adenylyltransferase